MILINCVGGFRGSQKKGEGGGKERVAWPR